MAAYFPAEKNDEYLSVQRVFGLKNMAKMLRELEERHREEVVKSLLWEASMWTQYPTEGPLGQYRKLQHELDLLRDSLNQLIMNMGVNKNHAVLPPNNINGHDHTRSVILGLQGPEIENPAGSIQSMMQLQRGGQAGILRGPAAAVPYSMSNGDGGQGIGGSINGGYWQGQAGSSSNRGFNYNHRVMMGQGGQLQGVNQGGNYFSPDEYVAAQRRFLNQSTPQRHYQMVQVGNIVNFQHQPQNSYQNFTNIQGKEISSFFLLLLSYLFS
ncbi:putative LOB domain-containing protein [Quillaja saponaria]|uniref:LOB domain-containing protein n=1 Tax=Quillaja saponaria TaxID=32244 RepID=A0AAD7KWT4_QUISA|nr:putative LOB domain-containing protein [Quillaja saponaria]